MNKICLDCAARKQLYCNGEKNEFLFCFYDTEGEFFHYPFNTLDELFEVDRQLNLVDRDSVFFKEVDNILYLMGEPIHKQQRKRIKVRPLGLVQH